MTRALALILPLAGCGALPMALGAAGGAATLAKDVIGVDISLHQLRAVEGAPVAPARSPERAAPVSQEAVSAIYNACVSTGAFDLRGGRLIMSSRVSPGAADVIVATEVDQVCGYPTAFAPNLATARAVAAWVVATVRIALTT